MIQRKIQTPQLIEPSFKTHLDLFFFSFCSSHCSTTSPIIKNAACLHGCVILMLKHQRFCKKIVKCSFLINLEACLLRISPLPMHRRLFCVIPVWLIRIFVKGMRTLLYSIVEEWSSSILSCESDSTVRGASSLEGGQRERYYDTRACIKSILA